jgi:cytochrome c oxidase accessory protein FixG
MIQDDEKLAKLNMLDEHGHRKLPIPAEVKGVWKNRRVVVQSILLVLFLILPWIQIGGHQAILIDIPKREFAFFGLVLYSHDAPLLFFLVFGLAILLALMTALYGRIWCGWACPQTVFIERVYRQVEIWLDGNYRDRRKLRDQELNVKKIAKSLIKWTVFAGISYVIAKSFLAYFNVSNSNAILFFTLIFTWNFGWFREQFCLIACPYGKVQSLLMDAQSVTVMYDNQRTDCIECGRCSQVCPTGIDIRNGLQMECIGCTACIDACDEIMEKVKKPKGLIRYKALEDVKINWWRPRVLIYATLASVSFVSLALFAFNHSDERFVILRGKTTPFVVTEVKEQKVVLNQFIFRTENKGKEDLEIYLDVGDQAQLQISQNPMKSIKNKKMDFPFFLLVPLQAWPQSGSYEILLNISINGEVTQKKLTLIGPQGT